MVDIMPWSVHDGVLTWESGPKSDRLEFSVSGVRLSGPGRRDRTLRWDQVTRVEVRLPIWGKSVSAIYWVAKGLHPNAYGLPPWSVEVDLDTVPALHALNLGRPRHYPWRVQLILDEVIDLLKESGDYSVLGRLGFLDRVVREVVPSTPRRARVLREWDLFGVERRIGGYRAVRQQIAALVREGSKGSGA